MAKKLVSKVDNNYTKSNTVRVQPRYPNVSAKTKVSFKSAKQTLPEETSRTLDAVLEMTDTEEVETGPIQNAWSDIDNYPMSITKYLQDNPIAEASSTTKSLYDLHSAIVEDDSKGFLSRLSSVFDYSIEGMKSGNIADFGKFILNTSLTNPLSIPATLAALSIDSLSNLFTGKDLSLTETVNGYLNAHTKLASNMVYNMYEEAIEQTGTDASGIKKAWVVGKNFFINVMSKPEELVRRGLYMMNSSYLVSDEARQISDAMYDNGYTQEEVERALVLLVMIGNNPSEKELDYFTNPESRYVADNAIGSINDWVDENIVNPGEKVQQEIEDSAGTQIFRYGSDELQTIPEWLSSMFSTEHESSSTAITDADLQLYYEALDIANEVLGDNTKWESLINRYKTYFNMLLEFDTGMISTGDIDSAMEGNKDFQYLWSRSAGARWTHMMNPSKAIEYEKLISSGANPNAAGDATQEFGWEVAWGIAADPNNFFGFDAMMLKGMWGIPKSVFTGVKDFVVDHSAVARNISNWATALTISSQGSKAAIAAADVLDEIHGRYGNDLSVSDMYVALRAGGYEFMPELTSYYKRALAQLVEVVEDYPLSSSTLNALTFDEFSKLLRARAFHSVTNELKEEAIARGVRLFGDGSEVSKLDTVLNNVIQTGTDWLKGSNIQEISLLSQRVFKLMKGVQYSIWLGSRPGWVVRNAIDNVHRFLLDNGNIFKSIDSQLRWYTPLAADAITHADGTVTSKLVDDAIAALSNSKYSWFNIGKNQEAIDSLSKLMANLAIGSMGQELVSKEQGRMVKRMTWFFDNNYTLSGKIEAVWRTRSYITKLQRYTQDYWTSTIAEMLGNAVGDSRLAGSVIEQVPVQQVATRLAQNINPSLDTIVRELSPYIDGLTESVYIKSFGLENFVPEALEASDIERVSKALDTLLQAGEGTVRAQDVDRIIDSLASRVDNAQDLRLSIFYDEQLAKFGDSIDWDNLNLANEIYEEITTNSAGRTQGEVIRNSIMDVSNYTQRIDIEASRSLSIMWNAVRDESNVGRQTAIINNYLNVERPAMYQRWYETQKEVLTRLGNDWNTLYPNNKLPDNWVNTWIDAARDMNEAIAGKYRELSVWSSNNWRGINKNTVLQGFSSGSRNAEYNAIRMRINHQLEVLLTESHSSLNGIRDKVLRMMENTLGIDSNIPNMTDGAWWRVIEEFNSEKNAIISQYDIMREDISRLKNTIGMFLNEPSSTLTPEMATRSNLSSWAKGFKAQVMDAFSEIQDRAISETNDDFFDYVSTSNLDSLLGTLTPFVRFPSRNLPYWIRQFSTHPGLLTNTYIVRHALAVMNRDLPESERYTIPIATFSDNQLWQDLGIANTTLRLNIFAYHSLFQQLPGATPYDLNRLQQMFDEETWGTDAGSAKTVFAMISELAGQFGFGLWPHLEYLLGMLGILGKDWYPGDVLSQWSPLIQSITSTKENPEGYNPDRFIRKAIPGIWNSLVHAAGLPESMYVENINPDLMISWLAANDVERSYIIRMSKEAAQHINLSNARRDELIAELEAGQVEENGNVWDYNQLEKEITGWFDGTTEQMNEHIMSMQSDYQIAVFLKVLEQQSYAIALKRTMVRTALNIVAGVSGTISPEEEAGYLQMLAEKNQIAATLGPGAAKRTYLQEFYNEHPEYSAISNQVYGDVPYATTTAGEEAEIWDSRISQAESEVYDTWDRIDTETNTQVQEWLSGDLLNPYELTRIMQENYDAKQQAKSDIEQALLEDLENRLSAYKATYPTDYDGIAKLEYGYDAEVYVSPQLTEEQRSELYAVASELLGRSIETDDDFYNSLAELRDYPGFISTMKSMYNEARQNTSIAKTEHIPGLLNGLGLTLQFNEKSHSDEEVFEYVIGNTLRELASNGPQYDDYENPEDYYSARTEYMENLSQHALEMPSVQQQVRVLVRAGRTQEEAEQLVSSWYEQEDLDALYKENDTMEEALIAMYKEYYYYEANDYYQENLAPYKDTMGYELWNLELETFFNEFGRVDATEFIEYIMYNYPGRWTQLELENTFRDKTLPSVQDMWALNSTGKDLVGSTAQWYYDQLDDAERRLVREGFSDKIDLFTAFTDGMYEDLSVGFLGEILNVVSAAATGEEIDYRGLSGYSSAVAEDDESANEYVRATNLPNMSATDVASWENAMRINQQVLEMEVNGEDTTILKNDEDYERWIGSSAPAGMAWNMWYSLVPPGNFSSSLKETGLIQSMLDSSTRSFAMSDQQYDKVISLIEQWYQEALPYMEAYGINPDDYEAVRDMYDEYYSIPYEEKEARSNYLESHPLLQTYMDAEFDYQIDTSGNKSNQILLNKEKEILTIDSSEGSDSNSGATSSNSGSHSRSNGSGSANSSIEQSEVVWNNFTSAVGNSYSTVLRVLTKVWNNNTLTNVEESYLQSLYAKLGAGYTFEDWVKLLKIYWLKNGTSSSKINSSSKNLETVRAYYNTSIRGRKY